jgi:hypothetical protein
MRPQATPPMYMSNSCMPSTIAPGAPSHSGDAPNVSSPKSA